MKEDERFTEVCEPLFNKVLTDLKQIKVAVCGDEASSRPGLGERVRKLETKAKVMIWMVSIAAASVIGVVVQRVWTWLNGQ